MRRVFFLAGLLCFAPAIVGTPQFQLFSSPVYAGEGGDGGEQSFKTPKKSGSKFQDIAYTVEDNYRTYGMSYYFSKKSRMRRLLKRMYEEKNAGESHIRGILKKIQYDGLDLGNSKKYKPGLAFNILSASNVYNNYRDGKLSKSVYESEMMRLLKFVP